MSEEIAHCPMPEHHFTDVEACCEHCHEACHFIADALTLVKASVRTKKVLGVLEECILRAEACCDHCEHALGV